MYGGSYTDFAVTGGVGTMSVKSAGSSARATVFTHDIINADVTSCVSIDSSAAGASNTAGLLLGYQDTDKHYIARAECRVSASHITDTFTRTTTSGWGNADSSQAWTVSGTASESVVDGSA